MPLSKKPIAQKRATTVHVWGLDKSGKSDLALSAPKPALINFDRNEDTLLDKKGLGDILRDRIVVAPAGAARDITVGQAKLALTQFEGDVEQALKLKKANALETLIIDGGSLLTDMITLVKLDESSNPNTTFRYAGRNAYIKNLFNSLNESGLNVIWTSKAKPLWVGNQRVPGQYVPDCHDDIPYMVDINVQMVFEVSPQGGIFRGVIGTNGFNMKLYGKGFTDLNWDMLMKLVGLSDEPEEEAAE